VDVFNVSSVSFACEIDHVEYAARVYDGLRLDSSTGRPEEADVRDLNAFRARGINNCGGGKYAGSDQSAPYSKKTHGLMAPDSHFFLGGCDGRISIRLASAVFGKR